MRQVDLQEGKIKEFREKITSLRVREGVLKQQFHEMKTILKEEYGLESLEDIQARLEEVKKEVAELEDRFGEVFESLENDLEDFDDQSET